MSWGNVATIGASIIGAWGSKKSADKQAEAASKSGQLDPRIASLLFGGNGQVGLIDEYRKLGQQPQSDASKAFAGQNNDYLSRVGGLDLAEIRHAALKNMNGNAAPTTTAAQAAGVQQAAPEQISNPAFMSANNMVQAPSQNGINLTPTFESLLGGGNTDALTKSLQAGNALTSAQFQQNQSNLTDNFQRNVLPSVRGGAIAAGQFGGSRQGIAEGLAMSDLTKQINNSNTQLGLANSANTASQLANAYENGQNRALSAAQGLSGQQYATAFKDTDTRNMSELTNVNMVNDLLKTNTAFRQQTNMANADRAQQNNQFNAGLQQQTGLANQGAQLTTNAQNNSAGLGGAGLLSGLLGQVSGNVNANDNWNLTRAQGVNSLLQPYLSNAPTQNPVSANTGGAMLGGGLMGLGLGNSLAGLFQNMGGSSGSSAPSGSYFDGYGYMPK